MNDAQEHREQAAALPDGDVVGVLLRQHADITEAMERVQKATSAERANAFEALKSFLKAHETAEESVIHPLTRSTAGEGVSDARVAEEKEADQVLVELSGLDPASTEFDTKFTAFMTAVSTHAENEENEEFPTISKERTDEQRIKLGEEFLAAFDSAAAR